ncbi:MAG TPA: hypothetical protein V6C58_03090 [Allocoleopsis sp.]
MTTFTVEIPDDLMSHLQHTGYPIQDLVLKAIERYIKSEDIDFDMTKTRTWELCGTFTVANPEQNYIVGQDEQGNIITNYGEKID